MRKYKWGVVPRRRCWCNLNILLCAALGIGLVLLLFLMKPSAAEKGAHVAAE
jgi:hypothetical protein